jgi:hypothetical protein
MVSLTILLTPVMLHANYSVGLIQLFREGHFFNSTILWMLEQSVQLLCKFQLVMDAGLAKIGHCSQASISFFQTFKLMLGSD